MRRALLLAALPLAACQPGAGQTGVEPRIAAATARIAALEAEIDRNAGPLATRTEAIRAEIRYRPVASWARSFSARPAAERTLSFHQTGSGGRLVEQVEVCAWRGRKSGYWASVAPSGAAATLVVGGLTVTPGADGILVAIPLDLSAGASVEGHYQLPCLPWGPTLTAGFSASASPAASFRLNLTGVEQGALGYSLDLVAPTRLGVAARVELGMFQVDFALPMSNLARQLTQGRIDLPYNSSGTIALPGGASVPYAIAVRDQQLTIGADAIIVSANLDIAIGDGRPLAEQIAGPR